MGRSKTVIRDRRETRHGLHFILTVCTCGGWALVGWPVAWLWNKVGPKRKTTVRTKTHE
jgi:hypothetical protein